MGSVLSEVRFRVLGSESDLWFLFLELSSQTTMTDGVGK
jgi:hypothetical protein